VRRVTIGSQRLAFSIYYPFARLDPAPEGRCAVGSRREDR